LQLHWQDSLLKSIYRCLQIYIRTHSSICGFEAGIDKKWREAPQFYWLYTSIIAIGAGIILLPNAPLISISLWSQRIDGTLLPVVLVCMMHIINNAEVMGKHTNKKLGNIVGWGTIAVLVILSW